MQASVDVSEAYAACARERLRWRLAVRSHRTARAAVDREVGEHGVASPETRAALAAASRALLAATRTLRRALEERRTLAPSR